MPERIMSDEFDGLHATEKAGIGAALNRCRALAAKIANELRYKRPEHFVDKLSLADVHASLECTADVLSVVAGAGPSPEAHHSPRSQASMTPLAILDHCRDMRRRAFAHALALNGLADRCSGPRE